MYSEEQLYQLMGEKNSMKQLLTEVRALPALLIRASFSPCLLWAKGFTGWEAFPYSPVLTGAPAPTGRAAVFCRITLHPKVPKSRHDPVGFQKTRREKSRRVWFPQPSQTRLI